VAATKAFFRKAIKSQQCCPRIITLDGYSTLHRAVRELKADGCLPTNTKLPGLVRATRTSARCSK